MSAVKRRDDAHQALNLRLESIERLAKPSGIFARPAQSIDERARVNAAAVLSHCTETNKK
jgi:hypothetical protein